MPKIGISLDQCRSPAALKVLAGDCYSTLSLDTSPLRSR
ncbi:hypothetical protein [Mycobacterium phage Kashi_RDG1]|nr:hypothetical protein [Mycobacterium phage Kashi_RDG1]